MKTRLRRLAVCLLLLVVPNVLRVAACAPREDAAQRLDFLATRINHHEFSHWAPGAPFDGEWRLVTLSMSVIAATNEAMRTPQSRELQARRVGDWVKLMSSEEVRAYETAQWAGSDALASLDGFEGHAGYLGHLALAMDAACLLGAERDEALHARVVAALARRLDGASDGLIETYPSQRFVPDTVVVAAAVRQFDACAGRELYAPLVARWLQRLQAEWTEAQSGLLVFAPGQGARGSGAGWNSFFLPMIDLPFARAQSRRLWVTFGAEGLFAGVREGAEGDVDSGPLVFGLSPSATGFALADATWHSREERAGLLRTAELAGVTWVDHFLVGPLVGDAIFTAARSMTAWRPLERASVTVLR